MLGEEFLVDTNILVRSNVQSPLVTEEAYRAVSVLRNSSSPLYATLQSFSEFWNVSTRPVANNGYAFTPSWASAQLEVLEQTFIFLPHDQIMYAHWRGLVSRYDIRGKQVHDAKLVASMLAYDIPNLLTYNVSDFKRFSEITAVHPENIR
jgi:predicted nucleic acid-binding protein